MKLLDLILYARQAADDLGGDTGTVISPYTYYWEQNDSGCLWKNTEWVRFFNQAHREIAIRTNCYRESTDSMCKISVAVGTKTYDLDNRILTVEDVRLSDGTALTKWTLNDYRDTAAAYTTTGTPQYYFEESRPFRLTLYPIPDETDTLYLTVYRYPLDEMSWTTRKAEMDEPDESLREALIQGALMYAYQKRDVDTGNLGLQKFHATEFERLVGRAVDHRTLENRRYNANLDISVRAFGYVPKLAGTQRWYETDD
jgi:hypothetical protein